MHPDNPLPHCRQRALDRYRYLVSKFEPVSLPTSGNRRFVFSAALPRAKSFPLAVNSAMVAEGLTLAPLDARPLVEVSEKDRFMLEHLKELFVSHSPVEAPDEEGRSLVATYLYGATRSIPAGSGLTIEQALERALGYTQPAPIRIAPVARESILEAFHRALRTHCDSPQTTATWHALHVVSSEYEWLVDLLQRALTSSAYETFPELVKGLRQLLLDDRTHFGVPARTMLLAQFRTFTDEDWYGALANLVEFPGAAI
jgi:hypothetical protein